MIAHLSDLIMYLFFFIYLLKDTRLQLKIEELSVFLYDIDSKIIIQTNYNFCLLVNMTVKRRNT